MDSLVFIDDNKIELDDFRHIVEPDYECTTVQWPHESGKLFALPAPSIFVSDLYLPSPIRDSTPTVAQTKEAADAAQQVAEQFSNLYADPSLDAKARGTRRHTFAMFERA